MGLMSIWIGWFGMKGASGKLIRSRFVYSDRPARVLGLCLALVCKAEA